MYNAKTMSLYRVKKKSVTKIDGKKLASYTTYLSNILSLKLAINCHKILDIVRHQIDNYFESIRICTVNDINKQYRIGQQKYIS
jgi:hypothetical protein